MTETDHGKPYTDADVETAVAKLIHNGSNPGITCDLPAGHDGWHRSGLAEWREIPPQTDWSHDIAFTANGTWSISHPDGCPGRAFGDCDVVLAAVKHAARGHMSASMAGLRFRCAVNDVGDRFLLGDRIDAEG